MAWRLAKSLAQLRRQINAKYPDRDKVSDGTVGDLSHQGRPSDHNPNSAGVVTAFDCTHDPKGPDGHVLSEQLIADPRVKYVIWFGRIWKAKTRVWEKYRGLNPHKHHVHVSVKAELADDESPWTLGSSPSTPTITLKRGDKGSMVSLLQTKLRAAGYSVAVDGNFGVITEANLRRFQTSRGLVSDGIATKATWEALK